MSSHRSRRMLLALAATLCCAIVGVGLGMLVKPILAKEGPERNGATALSERQETQPAAAPAPPTPRFQYAVKFICGRGDGKVVAQGSYFTAINVHNPTGDAVGFSKKFAVALPEEKAG